MQPLKELLGTTPAKVLVAVVLLSTLLPTGIAWLALGQQWRGVPVTYTDETLYQAQVQMVGRGNLTAGNPYLFEHRSDLPLVIFGGDWVNAIPQLLGLPFVWTNFANLIFFALFFAIALYLLFLELKTAPVIALFATLLIYFESFAWVQRVSNMQPFLPFFALFYLALVRYLKESSRRRALWLGLAAGVMCYFYAFLWQAFAITMALLVLYSLWRRDTTFITNTVIASLVAAGIGFPAPLYMLWLSHANLLFWESVSRYGLVSTHLPMMEVLYSGGFIGLTLLYVAYFYLSSPSVAKKREVYPLLLFITLSGAGLWIMEGSNLFTGKLLETAEHIKLFVYKFYAIDAVVLGTLLYTYRQELKKRVRILGIALVTVLLALSAYYTWLYFYQTFFGVLSVPQSMQDWKDEQAYAGPITWLEQNEKEPVVVWVDPNDYISWYFAVLSRHYVLFATPSIWHLTSDEEIRERYLVAEYFNNPSVDDLKANIPVYMGRNIVYHQAKTIERGVKLCRLLHFYDRTYDCGAIPTSLDVIGESTFTGLEKKFLTQIKPHIKEYLAKYHVKYVLKDLKKYPQYNPKELGGVLVYSDSRYELYQLP